MNRGFADRHAKEIYPLFEARIDFGKFSQLFGGLDEQTMGRFIRACHLHMKSTRLKDFDPNISMALFCSAVESTQPRSSSSIFKDWLVKKKLSELEGKSSKELGKLLERAYQEYTASESEREGATYNFKQFLLKHCPTELRTPPMEVYPKHQGTPRKATFEESLGYIYSKFRSLFIHEGIGRLETERTDETIVYSDLTDVYRGDGYTIDMMKVLNWFSQVVLESLWNWFMKEAVRL